MYHEIFKALNSEKVNDRIGSVVNEFQQHTVSIETIVIQVWFSVLHDPFLSGDVSSNGDIRQAEDDRNREHGEYSLLVDSSNSSHVDEQPDGSEKDDENGEEQKNGDIDGI